MADTANDKIAELIAQGASAIAPLLNGSGDTGLNNHLGSFAPSQESTARKNYALRRQAMKMVVELPADRDSAIAILEYARALVDQAHEFNQSPDKGFSQDLINLIVGGVTGQYKPTDTED